VLQFRRARRGGERIDHVATRQFELRLHQVSYQDGDLPFVLGGVELDLLFQALDRKRFSDRTLSGAR